MLYQSMGMERKYCAYLRQAALEAVGDTIPIRAYLLGEWISVRVYTITHDVYEKEVQWAVINDLMSSN